MRHVISRCDGDPFSLAVVRRLGAAHEGATVFELAARGVRLSDCNPVFLAVLHHARDALRGVVEVLRWPSGWKTAEKTPRFCRRGG